LTKKQGGGGGKIRKPFGKKHGGIVVYFENLRNEKLTKDRERTLD
jgi:hypothetical protein